VGQYLLRRSLQSLVVILGLTIIVFGIARLSGSPADLLLPMGASPQQRADLVQQLGLDRPLPVQYVTFLAHALRGDFGESIRFHTAALPLVLGRLPATVELALASLLFAVAAGIPLGILAALHYRKAGDYLVTTGTTLGQATPSFWLGIMLILVFGVQLKWFPISGNVGIKSLVLPAFTLSIVPLVTIAKITRSSMIGTLPQDYVRTAQSKGLPWGRVVRHHALRNALIPVVTVIGVLLGSLLSGAVITEQIFAWPGIGRLTIESINARDFPVVQAVTLITSVAIVGANLLVDLSYSLLDPRIRRS
jgi:peptide/nickel transport system permease protein